MTRLVRSHAAKGKANDGRLKINTGFRVGRTQVLAHPYLLLMLPQQLLSNGVAVFGNDPNQAIDILRMIADQFGELLHLRFKMLQTPTQSFLLFGSRFFLGRCHDFFSQGRDQHILFHIHPFSPPLE